MSERISSLDVGYTTGLLSIYPEAIDNKESLYEVRNNAETVLKQTISFGSKLIIVKDASSFPPTGILRIGPGRKSGNSELIYYAERTGTVFKDLCRGFAGSIRSGWDAGTAVGNAVSAEPHNAIKDALLNIQERAGLDFEPDVASINGILKALETRFLAPKSAFRGFPRSGPPPLTVRFQNFSEGHIIRNFWDFGDGTTSIEKNPCHEYQTEGIFTVKLNVITSDGAQGSFVKSNYIEVSEEKRVPFFYVVLENQFKPAYSIATATSLVISGEDPAAEPANFQFIDQTDGNIISRFWTFDDGDAQFVTDNPNIHSAEHVYSTPGEFNPSLIVTFADGRLKHITLPEKLTVL